MHKKDVLPRDPEVGERPVGLGDVIDLMPDAVVISDESGSLVLANRQAERLFGFTKQELSGLRVEDLLPERFRERHVSERTSYCHDPRVRPMGAALALFGRRRDGSEFPTEISLSPLRENGRLLIIAAVRDRTEHRRLEEELRLSEERLRLLVGTVKEYAIFMLDAGGRITTWNAGGERLTGYKTEEIMGSHFSVFYRPQDTHAGRPDGALQNATSHGQYLEEIPLVRQDGSLFQADVSLTALRDSRGNLYGFADVTRDITEQRRAETERREAIEAREELLDVVAHDLQNVANTVALNTQILLRMRPATEVEDRMRKLAELIDRSCETMNRLLRDVLDARKIERGRLAIDRQPEVLVTLLREAIAPLEVVASEKSVRLETRLETESATVLCDHGRIVQVLQNLIGNAIKFVQESGSVVVEAMCTGPSEVRITVSDNGPGIEPEDLAHVFERYWRSGSTALKRGSGLGLFIVKTIVEAHGGRTWVDSTPSTGSKFHFTLERV